MKKIIILLLGLTVAVPSFSAMKTFAPQEQIKASDINHNFGEVEGLLLLKNTNVSFTKFQSGTVIRKENFETEFDKIRNLGVGVDSLSSEYIISEELNNIFAQIIAGVQSYDDPPLASDSIFSVNEDENHLVTFNYINNVGPSIIQIVSPPSNGVLVPAGSSFTYSPNLNYNGSDSFSYKVSDGLNLSNTAQVSITIVSVNDAPVANAQSIATNEDTALNITLSGTDIENSPLTYEIVSMPSNGILSGSGTNRIYNPTQDFNGSDSFTFRVNDGTDFSTTKTVSITINAVNDIPVADTQLLSTNEDIALNITLTGSDIDNDLLTYSVVTAPTNGVLSGSDSNRTYTPSTNFNGSDSFTFRVNDGTIFSTTKTILITVNAVNDIPVANTQTLATNEDTALNITLTGSDTEGSPLTYAIVTNPLNGSITGTPPNIVYTPNLNYNGADSFTFKVNDGTSDSVAVSVALTINAVNDIPVVSGNQNIIVVQNSFLASSVSATDVEGSALVYSVSSAPTKGSVVFGSNGSYTYTASLNTFGADSFSVRAYDGVAFSTDYAINVQINGSGIITNSGVRTYFDGTYANSCNQYLNQASGNYNYTGATGTGTYRIKPDAGIATTYDVHCDMVSEGGGWTRVNSSIATAVTGSFNASQQMVVTNLPSSDCAPGSPSMRVNNVKVPFTKIRLDFIRASTVIQCPRILAYASLSVLNESTGYVDGVNLTPWPVCTWADNVWTKAPQGVLSISGLRTSWRIIGDKDPASTGYRFYSICSGAGDNGQITATWFVR